MNTAQKHLIKVDPILGKIINTIPPPQVESTNNVFHDLMSCILEQQIHYRSTKNIFKNMLKRSNVTLLTLKNFTQFEKKAFDGIKISMRKYETVANIVEHWNNHKFNWKKMSNEEIKNELTQIKGIGDWTIDMMLIYTLNRPDVFSYDDFHIKQIMTSVYQLNPKVKLKAQMKAVSEPWSPHQSTAFQYLLDWKKFVKTR